MAGTHWTTNHWTTTEWVETHWTSEEAVVVIEGDREYLIYISYGGTPLFVNRSAEIVDLDLGSVGTQKRSPSGKTETLVWTYRPTVTLTWAGLTAEQIQDIQDYWENWGRLGLQAVLKLDRVSRDAGSWEVDFFNTYFTKAELIDPSRFHPRRSVEWHARYDLTLSWRQGL